MGCIHIHLFDIFTFDWSFIFSMFFVGGHKYSLLNFIYVCVCIVCVCACMYLFPFVWAFQKQNLWKNGLLFASKALQIALGPYKYSPMAGNGFLIGITFSNGSMDSKSVSLILFVCAWFWKCFFYNFETDFAKSQNGKTFLCKPVADGRDWVCSFCVAMYREWQVMLKMLVVCWKYILGFKFNRIISVI